MTPYEKNCAVAEDILDDIIKQHNMLEAAKIKMIRDIARSFGFDTDKIQVTADTYFILPIVLEKELKNDACGILKFSEFIEPGKVIITNTTPAKPASISLEWLINHSVSITRTQSAILTINA